MGVGEVLKLRKLDVKVVVVELYDLLVLFGGNSGLYKI